MAKKQTAGMIAAEVGAGAAALGAAAALGYYFFAGDDAKKHRKIAAVWANDMKKEVMKEVEMLKEKTPGAVALIVDRIAETYRDVRGIDESAVERASKELKQNWKEVERETQKRIRTVAKKVKKATT